MTDNRYAVLFEPVKIGPVTAPNRFYAVPHATGHGWNQPQGAIALRAMKAQGGWGTVAVQMCEIAPNSDMANHPMERIWDDSDLPRHVAQVDAIKRHNSLAGIELAHGGMRSRNITTGAPVIGPSALPILRPEVPLQSCAMSVADINAFRASHKAAAQRAKHAGYDILYVYAAHDLTILSHFLSRRTNQRTDNYGGSFNNRLRLLREVLEDTLEVAAGDCAVAIRFSVAEPSKSVGLTHDGEGRDVVEALAELPDLWDVNISGWPQDSATARFADEGFQQSYTGFVKSVTSKPVVGVGRFTSPDLMVSLINKGELDLIGGARPSIADPFLPNKIRDNRIDEIRECIGCNICVSMDSYGLPVRCTQNPTISEEWRRDWHPESPAISHNPRSHLVIGAGPAGLECAVTLARAGQRVTIAEATNDVGGRVTNEARLPGLSSFGRVRDYRLGQLNTASNAQIYLDSLLTLDDVKEFGADTVTVATGSRWRADGVGSTNFDPIDFGDTPVLTPEDIMLGNVVMDAPTTFVVYDDDHFYMASAVAESLVACGHTVIYACPMPMIATWTDNTLDLEAIIERLNSLGVAIQPNVKLTHDVTFRSTLTGQDVDITGTAPYRLVFVGARTPQDTLYQQLLTSDAANAVFQVGDCVSPGIIQAAVLSGHTVARRILDEKTSERLAKRAQITV